MLFLVSICMEERNGHVGVDCFIFFLNGFSSFFVFLFSDAVNVNLQ